MSLALLTIKPTATPKSVCALFIRPEDQRVCAVTRRHRYDDLALPGGKIFPGETPIVARIREVGEELGPEVQVLGLHLYFERKDEADDDNIAWCFHITRWIGEPKQNEDGILVSWEKPARLLEPNCTFREYNRKLFEAACLL